MPDIHTSPNHYWSLKRQKLSLISSSSVPKFSITLLTVVVPSRLRILGIPCCSSRAVLGKHSCTTAVLRTFAFKSFRMLRFICLWQTLRVAEAPLLANIFDQDHRILRICLIHGLSLLSSTRYPVLSIILAIAIRLVQPSLYLRVELR